MVNMIINKQITIIITCPKPVVSPKLIYDELWLKFLGTGEWGEQRAYCTHHGAQNGVRTGLSLRQSFPVPREPGRAPREGFSLCLSGLLSPPATLKFFRYFTCISNSVILLKFIQRIYAYEIII